MATALSITEVGLNSGLNPVAYDTADSGNNNEYENDGNTIVLMKNDTGGPASITVVSVPDEALRTGDITFTLADGDEAFIPPLRKKWWNDGSGNVLIELDTNIKIAVLRLP